MFPFVREAVNNLFSRPSTVEYPNKVSEVKAKPGYRGRISYDASKCVNCGPCRKVCSPSSITVIEEETEGGKNITYEFDLTSCTFCATCQDFCDEGAIVLTDDYHMVATDARDLVVRGTRFVENSNKILICGSDCIYCGLCMRNCPQSAITVDRKEKSWIVDHSKCVQCGICVGKCPKKTLSLEEPGASCQMDAAMENAASESAAMENAAEGTAAE